MSSIVTLGKRADTLDASPQFDGYSKVIIHIDQDNQVSAGDDTGRTLEIDNPWGTQQMAQDILTKLQGYRYQPYSADGALLDPAAEIGDGVTIGNIYGGIYQRDVTFSRLMKANISAPEDKEINHEFQYESPTERKFSREIGDVRASLIVQSNQIAAKVDSTSNGESFGWQLLSDHWSVVANGNEVFRVDQSGGTFTGEVRASSGQIGGFTITASAIYNNLNEFGGSQSTGVYIGTNGIQLGQNFKVTSSGSVTANNMTLTGTLNVGGSYITAGNLYSGAYSAYTTGGYWSGGSSLGYTFGNATNRTSGKYPDFFRATVMYASGSLQANAFQYGTQWLTLKTATIAGTTIHYLGY